MNRRKWQVWLVFFIVTILLVVISVYCIQSMDGKLGIMNVALGISLLLVYICEFICIGCLFVRLGIPIEFWDEKLTVGKEEVGLFISGSTPEVLNAINIKGGIVGLQGYSTGRKGLRLEIIQSKNLFLNKKFDLDVFADYGMFFNTTDIGKVDPPGLCIFVKNDPAIVKSNIEKAEKEIFRCVRYVKIPEMRDGVLSLRYEYTGLVEVRNKETAKLFLNTKVDFKKNITLYDLLLRDIFKLCPNDKESVLPVSGKNETYNFWINTPNGQMALFLLRNFPLEEVVGRRKVYDEENGKRNLNQLIGYVQSYIESNSKTVDYDNAYLNQVFDRLKNIQCEKSGINLYKNLHSNYYIANGKRINHLVSRMISKDSQDEPYSYIFAIASYQDNDSCIKTNEFIKKLLRSEGCEHLIEQAELMLKDSLHEKIIAGSACYESMKTADVMKALSINQYCTGQELITRAREYLMVHCCIPEIMPVYNRVFSVEMGPVTKVVLMPEEKFHMMPAFMEVISAKINSERGKQT
ncbi:hypothetical protein K6025_02835 [Ehrlichia sp. JZT12]